MSNILWILLSGGCLAVATVLLVRRRQRKQFLEATAVVRLTNEMWEIVQAVPPSHLSTPLREAIAQVFRNCAEIITVGPLAMYGASLAERSAEVQQLPRTAPSSQIFKGSEQNFVRLAKLLDVARQRNFLDKREHALARVAAGLAAELSSIDRLCLQAEHALTLRAGDEAIRLRREALKSCERLPAQTADEVRRRVNMRLPLSNPRS